MKTAQERQQEQKQAKLATMEQQIKTGKLVVRKMTAEERAKFPPREESADGPKRSRRR
jgi:hypothetical protein